MYILAFLFELLSRAFLNFSASSSSEELFYEEVRNSESERFSELALPSELSK
jgi:hypothetical protein